MVWMGKLWKYYVWRDIQHKFCEFEWYEWVIFQDKTAMHLDDHFRLGRYLGLSIEIVPALIAMIIRENGQVLHRSMHWVLTQAE